MYSWSIYVTRVLVQYWRYLQFTVDSEVYTSSCRTERLFISLYVQGDQRATFFIRPFLERERAFSSHERPQSGFLRDHIHYIYLLLFSRVHSLRIIEVGVEQVNDIMILMPVTYVQRYTFTTDRFLKSCGCFFLRRYREREADDGRKLILGMSQKWSRLFGLFRFCRINNDIRVLEKQF